MECLYGSIRVLVSKPSLCGFGMNFQHCADTGFVGLTDSFEQYYQAIRRFWRFGQSKPVNCHIIATETEGATVSNIRRKAAAADRMAAAMVKHMADLSSAAIKGSARDTPKYNTSIDRKRTRLNSRHSCASHMTSSACKKTDIITN